MGIDPAAIFKILQGFKRYIACATGSAGGRRISPTLISPPITCTTRIRRLTPAYRAHWSLSSMTTMGIISFIGIP